MNSLIKQQADDLVTSPQSTAGRLREGSAAGEVAASQEEEAEDTQVHQSYLFIYTMSVSLYCNLFSRLQMATVLTKLEHILGSYGALRQCAIQILSYSLVSLNFNYFRNSLNIIEGRQYQHWWRFMPSCKASNYIDLTRSKVNLTFL